MLLEIIFWSCALAVPVAAVALTIWRHDIRAHLVPRVEIEARAARLRQEHGESALAAAEAKEAAAYARGEAIEQGVWRRVAKSLRRG